MAGTKSAAWKAATTLFQEDSTAFVDVRGIYETVRLGSACILENFKDLSKTVIPKEHIISTITGFDNTSTNQF